MSSDQDQTLTLLSLSFPCQRSSPSQNAPNSSTPPSSPTFLHLTPPLAESTISFSQLISNQDPILMNLTYQSESSSMLHLSPQLSNLSEPITSPPVSVQESVQVRTRKNPHQGPRPGKGLTIQPAYRWATDKRAMVLSLEDLLAQGIRTISGEVKCQKCEVRQVVSYDIVERLEKIKAFLMENQTRMYSRAPDTWLHPRIPACPSCYQTGCLRPIMTEKKRDVNWLFLFLGEMLGFCNLKQLKYFCKHNGNHRTGGKPWVLYKAYVIMCMQLDPSISFL